MLLQWFATFRRRSRLQVLKEWRWHLLTTTFTFEVLATEDDLFWASNRLREDMRSRCDAVARTAVQRIFEICRWVARKEAHAGRLTANQVAKAYKDHLQLARSAERAGEDITEKYVTEALRLYHGTNALTPSILFLPV